MDTDAELEAPEEIVCAGGLTISLGALFPRKEEDK
jgi:hypothetical protein